MGERIIGRVKEARNRRIMVEIIIRRHDKYRGRNISELQDNLASEGWPTEVQDEDRDKIKWYEGKKKRAIKEDEISRALRGKLD